MGWIWLLAAFVIGLICGALYALTKARGRQHELELALTRAEADRSAIGSSLEQARAQFQALAADALKHNNESFVTLAQQTLAPFHQQAANELEKQLRATVRTAHCRFSGTETGHPPDTVAAGKNYQSYEAGAYHDHHQFAVLQAGCRQSRCTKHRRIRDHAGNVRGCVSFDQKLF